jgi:hypothetical protein
LKRRGEIVCSGGRVGGKEGDKLCRREVYCSKRSDKFGRGVNWLRDDKIGSWSFRWWTTNNEFNLRSALTNAKTEGTSQLNTIHNVSRVLNLVSENTYKSPGVIALACLKKKGLISSRTSSIPTFPGSNNSVALKMMIDPSAPPPLIIIFIGISGERDKTSVDEITLILEKIRWHHGKRDAKPHEPVRSSDKCS